MSESNRIDVGGSFTLPCEPDVAFPHFTPRGEMEWVPGWEPRFVHPPSGELEVDQVFVTAADGEETLWTVIACNAEARTAEYLRVTPGSRMGRVRVAVEPDVAGARVSVRYVLTALTPAAREELARFEAGFDAMLDEWRERTTRVVRARD